MHAWEAWGEACVERFRGMFAFALWDRNGSRRCSSRATGSASSRCYYALLPDGMLLFGSELKSLLAHGGLRARASTRCAVEDYFALGYVPEPRTIFTSARKLPPAHTLQCAARRSRSPRRAATGTSASRGDQRHRAADAAGRAARAADARSVRLRMISEVPLGAFLSGGVDSSAVVAMMARLSAEPVNTCSIAFADPAFDETRVRAAGRRALPHPPLRRPASKATTST